MYSVTALPTSAPKLCSTSATQSWHAAARARGGARDLQVEKRMLIAGVQPRSVLDKLLEGSHRHVCLQGLVYIPVVLLQCERSAQGISNGGQARQAGARARGGARDLQEVLSEFSVEACPCAAHEFDMRKLIWRGLILVERRRRLPRRDECCGEQQRVLVHVLIRSLQQNNACLQQNNA